MNGNWDDRSVAVLEFAGQTLLLHPERAAYWLERRTLIVADTHFAKGSLFRRHGIAVPDAADAGDRERLSRLVHASNANRLVILGDFVHGVLEAGSEEAQALAAWAVALAPTAIHVVAGNHDRGLLKRWRPPLHWHEQALIEEPFAFLHDADAERAGHDRRPTLSGHVHPVVRVGIRRAAHRVPVFWQRASGLVLPSFGTFTGGFAVTPRPGERVFAAGPEGVVAFPAVS